MELLHTDLLPYTDNGMVHHPLVIAMVTTDPADINRIYCHKRELLGKAEADRDWHEYVFLHERPYRLDALNRATKRGLSNKPSEYWRLVGQVWLDSENIYQNLAKWKRFWLRAIENQQACMSAEDLRIFDSLPEQIQVWRGTSYKRGINGLSWTLDEPKAAHFARRFNLNSRAPLVARGLAKKADIFAYFGERNEREIVSMQVSIISVTDIKHLPIDSRGPSRTIADIFAEMEKPAG